MTKIKTLFAMVIATISPTISMGQQYVCGPRVTLPESFKQEFGIHSKFLGMTSDKFVLELFWKEKSGRWAILVTSPEGTSCIVITGTDGINELGGVGDPT